MFRYSRKFIVSVYRYILSMWLIRMVSLQCYSRNHNIKDNGNIGMCDEIESLLPYMALQPVQSQPTNKNIILLLVFDWFNTQYYY